MNGRRALFGPAFFVCDGRDTVAVDEGQEVESSCAGPAIEAAAVKPDVRSERQTVQTPAEAR